MRLYRTPLLSLATALATGALTVVAAPTAQTTFSADPVLTMIGDYPVAYDAYGEGLTEAAHGTATTMTVDYSAAAPGEYTIKWDCGVSSSGWDHQLTSQIPDDAPGGTVVYPIDTTGPSTSCVFLVMGPATEYFVRLLQLDPELKISAFKVLTGPYVYPRIHQDSWRAQFVTNSPATVTTSVRNKAGKVVFSRVTGTYREEYHGDAARIWDARVAWDGLRNDDTQLPLGTYRVRVAVHSTRGTGHEVIGPIRVTLKPGRRPITKRDNLAGSVGTNFASGGCFSADQQNTWVWLNCSTSNGGPTALARSTWTFKVPRTAKLLAWSVVGGPAGDDRPGTGSIRKSITHPRPTIFRIKVTVNGRRSYIVQDVFLKYRYLK